MTVADIQTRLADVVLVWNAPDETRIYAQIECDDLITALLALAESGFYLAAITGLDHHGSRDGDPLEVLYHLCAGATVLTLRVTLERDVPELASAYPVFPIASVYERETGEMFGITFTGTPDTSRLFLPDDWQVGVYPLRKDALLEGNEDDG